MGARRRGSILSVTFALLAVTVGVTLGAGSAAHASPSQGMSRRSVSPVASAKSVLARINQLRVQAHLKPLKLDTASSLLAAQHSRVMAAAGRLYDVPNSAIRPFRSGGKVGQVVVAFTGYVSGLPSTNQVVGEMISARHGKGISGRHDVYSRTFNRVGLGVVRRTSSLWATAIFIIVQ